MGRDVRPGKVCGPYRDADTLLSGGYSRQLFRYMARGRSDSPATTQRLENGFVRHPVEENPPQESRITKLGFPDLLDDVGREILDGEVNGTGRHFGTMIGHWMGRKKLKNLTSPEAGLAEVAISPSFERDAKYTVPLRVRQVIYKLLHSI